MKGASACVILLRVNYLPSTLAEPQDAMEIPEEEQVNLANAIDLSESEEEEEMDDLINDFSLEEEMDIVRVCPFPLFGA